jgi:hypothetical protein
MVPGQGLRLGSTKLGGEEIKGGGGGGPGCRDASAADDAGGLWACTGRQVGFADSDETVKGGGAETEAPATGSVGIIDDVGEGKWRMHGISRREGRVEDETAACAAGVAGGSAAVLGRQLLPVTLLLLLLLLQGSPTLELEELDVVLGSALSGTLARIVGVEVGVRLGGTDVVDGVDRVVAGGDGLGHAQVAGRVERRAGHGSHRGRHGITPGGDGDLRDGREDRPGRDARIELAALDKVVDGLLHLCRTVSLHVLHKIGRDRTYLRVDGGMNYVRRVWANLARTLARLDQNIGDGWRRWGRLTRSVLEGRCSVAA